jgi:hypothetical protein
MKSLKQVMLSITLMSMLSVPAFAQDDLDQFFEGSVDDAEKLLGGYVSPLMKSLASGLNQGWYNTAKPHKIAGFDLTITVNAMFIPDKELTYRPNDMDLDEIELSPSSQGFPNAPTFFGSEDAPEYRFKDDPSTSFDGPPGIDMKGKIGRSIMPVPMAHLGFGLPKNTDIKFRFIPKIALDDATNLNMFGIGIMHDVKQWIPGLKMSPIDLSGFVGYTKFKMTSEFDEPGTEDARAVFEMTGLTIQGLISKKISVLTLYGGLGYNIAKSKLAMLGTYEVQENGIESNVTDPLNLDFASSGPRITGGFRLKLAVLTLHADYTLQKYSCFSAGFGIAVR